MSDDSWYGTITYFFPPSRRKVSEHEVYWAKDMDAKGLRSFEESAQSTIGFLVAIPKYLKLSEIDKLHKEVEEILHLGSGLGSGAHDLLQTLKAGYDALGLLAEKARIDASPDQAGDIRHYANNIRTLTDLMCHQAYIDVDRAEPANRLPTLLSCSVADLQFLFRDLPGLPDISAYWKKTKTELRAFAFWLMQERAEVNVKLIEDPDKLELLEIDAFAAPEDIEIDELRQYLLSQSDNPESIRALDPLLNEWQREHGNRIHVNQFLKLLSAEKLRLKTQMRSVVEKAQAEGKSASVEDLAQAIKIDMLAYRGPDRDTCIRKMDEYVGLARAKYGDRVPLKDLFKLIQQVERDLGFTDTIHQP